MQVTRREGETFEQLLRRFKQGVERSGLLRDMKRKRYHVSPGQARRLKAQAAQRRQRRRALRQKARG
jgi:small subunit ribosomal protein S21